MPSDHGDDALSTPPAASRTAKNEGKENHRHDTTKYENVSTRKRGGRGRRGGGINGGKKREEEEEEEEEEEAVLTRLLLSITSGEDDEDQRRLWNDDDNSSKNFLASCVARASASVSVSRGALVRGRGAATRATDGAILLEESAPKILASCRKFVREATEIAKRRKNDTKERKKKKNSNNVDEDDSSVDRALDCLCVGIHGLRSLVATNLSGNDSQKQQSGGRNNCNKQQEAAIKLLYHAATAAEDTFNATTSCTTASTSTTQTANSNSHSAEGSPRRERAASYSLAAYETLGRLLETYSSVIIIPSSSTSTPEDSRLLVQFRPLGDANEDYYDDNPLFDLFCVPVNVEEKAAVAGGSTATATATATTSSTLSLEQAAAIGILSTLSVARIVAKRITTTAPSEAAAEEEGGEWSFLREFGTTSVVSELLNHQYRRGDDSSTDSTGNSRTGPLAKQLLVYLVRTVLPRWISFLISTNAATTTTTTNDSSPCIKDVLSHCKHAHSVLWDAAGGCIDISAEECLSLRQEAVLALLGAGCCRDCSNDGTSSSSSSSSRLPPERIMTSLRDRYFQNACTCAWKASVLYAQETKKVSSATPASCLVRFHRQVGPVLDQFATTGDNNCLAYMEYSAYRAFHLGVSNCVTRVPATPCGSGDCQIESCPYPYAHSSDCCVNSERCSGNTAMLFLFFLCLHVSEQLKLGGGGGGGDDDDDYKTLAQQTPPSPFMAISSAERILEGFRYAVIEGRDKSCACHRPRYFKMIWMLSLHRTVFETVESSKNKSLSDVSGQQYALKIAAEILAEGVGPLAFGALETSEPEKRNQLWDAIGECYIRSMSVLEALAFDMSSRNDAANAEAYNRRANSVMETFASLLQRRRKRKCLSPPAVCIEKAAKFLAVVGKRRHEQELDAVQPLLHSLQLFLLWGSLPGCSEQSLQLSSRWSFLASVYRGRGLVDEAIIAMAAALSCDVYESSLKSSTGGSPEDPHFYLFRTMGRFTRGVISAGPELDNQLSSDHRRALVGRITGLLVERTQTKRRFEGDKSKASAISLTQTVSSLLQAAKEEGSADALFESSCGVPLSLGSILQVFLASSAVSSEPSTSHYLVVEKVKVILEVLVQAGRLLQTYQGQVDEDAPAVVDFGYVLRLALHYLRKIGEHDTDANTIAIKSVLYVFASVSLISHNPLVDFDRWNLDRENTAESEEKHVFLLSYATKLAQKAARVISTSPDVSESEWVLAVSALKPAIALYELQLSDMRRTGTVVAAYDGMLSVLRHSVEALSEHPPQASIAEASKWCAVSVLSRLCDSLVLEGEKLNAIQVAAWNDRVASRDLESGHHLWFEAAAIALQASDTVVAENFTPGPGGLFGSLDSSDAEVSACRLRQRLRGPLSHTELLEVERQLQSLLLAIESSIDPNIPDEQAPLFAWSRSTAFLGLSEVAERRGIFESGLLLARQCFRACQKLSNRIGRGRGCEGRNSSRPARPFWQEIAAQTLLIRCIQRQVDCLQRMAIFYTRIGDWRKADGYAMSATKLAGFEALHDTQDKMEFSQMIRNSRSRPCSNSQEMQLRRLHLSLRARATPWDLVKKDFQNELGVCNLSQTRSSELGHGLNRGLEDLINTLEVAKILGEGHTLLSSDELDEMHNLLDSGYFRFVQEPDVLALSGSMVSERNHCNIIAPLVFFNLKLDTARKFLSGTGVDSEVSEDEATKSCSDVIESSVASPGCQAEAIFYLGCIELGRARRKGELARIWQGHCNVEFPGGVRTPSSSVLKARKHFKSLLPLLGPASDLLTRNALRCLALVTGPEETSDASISASALIHASVGSAPRQRVASFLDGSTVPSECDVAAASTGESEAASGGTSIVAELFRALDTSFSDANRRTVVEKLFSALADHIRPEWRVVACTICPTGELLISSIELIREEIQHRTVCVFPDSDESGEYITTSYKSIVSPLDVLIKASQDQLRATSTSEVVEEEDKREWWRKRNNFDLDLQSLISDVENRWFGSESAQRVLCGSSGALLRGNDLASKFEAVSLPERDNGSPEQEEAIGDREIIGDACTLLILDEHLHRFPFEGMASLEGASVCRQPSLPFLVAKLVELAESGRAVVPRVDPESTTYILDPESNLSKTSDRIGPLLETWNTSFGGRWKGVLGTTPAKEFMEAGLTANDSLLLYFGHGGGQGYFSRSDIESLIGNDQEDNEGSGVPRQVRSAIVLMGCSSVRLESVNRKETELTGEQLPIYYEPEGIALSYLAAGAPCVVGNLWDVTDHDIDRFSVEMLERFLFDETSPASLAECVAEARSACKMRYIVGCAPVCYGLPVFKTRATINEE